MENTPLTPSERVKRSNAALLQRGGRRIPDGMLQPDAAAALADLASAGYADSLVAVISTALIDARNNYLQINSEKHCVTRLTSL